MNNPLLKGERVILRKMRTDDRDLILDWENRPELDHLGDEHEPLTRQQIDEFIARTTGDIHIDGQLRLMIVLHTSKRLPGQQGILSGQDDSLGRSPSELTVGCIDLFEFDPYNQRAGIGILIAEKEHRQKGYAKEAVQLVTNFGFEVLHLRQLFCHIPVDNLSSMRLFSSCGYEESGRCRDWVKKGDRFIDAIFMQRLNGQKNI